MGQMNNTFSTESLNRTTTLEIWVYTGNTVYQGLDRIHQTQDRYEWTGFSACGNILLRLVKDKELLDS